MPDVNIIEPTSILGNSSSAIPGLKHHQLSVLDAALPGKKREKRYLKAECPYNKSYV